MKKGQAVDIVLSKMMALSCGWRAVDDYLRGLVLDCLSNFSVRQVVVFSIRKDLRIELLGTYGMSATQIAELGHLHVMKEGPFSRCIDGESFEVRASNSDKNVPDDYGFGLFLDIPRAGLPFAGVALFGERPFDLDANIDFWRVVAMAVGLAASSNNMPKVSETRETANDNLTSRQLEILSLVSQGYTNRQIAKRLNFGVSTIGHELMRVFELLGVSSREAAVVEAARVGLVIRK